MRSSSLFLSATILLTLGASLGCDGCGDDSSASTSSGGGDAAQSTGTGGTSPSATGSGGSGGDTGPGAGGEGGTNASSSTSAGDGGGGAGSGGDPGDGLHYGRVLFANDFSGLEGDVELAGSVNAAFVETIEPASPDGCEETIEGACTLIVCPPFEGDPAVQEARTAGDFTFDGTTVPVGVEYDDGYYSFYLGGELIYEPGDELSVSATGDQVPAFSGSVIAPGHAIIETPSQDDLAFARDEDLVVGWSVEGGGGRLLAYLSTYDDTGSSAAIYCDWPMDDGEGTIPAAFMGELPETIDASLTLYDWAQGSANTDEWTIDVAAQGTPQTDSDTGTNTFAGIVLE